MLQTLPGQLRALGRALIQMSRNALPQPKVRLRSLPVPSGITATCAPAL